MLSCTRNNVLNRECRKSENPFFYDMSTYQKKCPLKPLALTQEGDNTVKPLLVSHPYKDCRSNVAKNLCCQYYECIQFFLSTKSTSLMWSPVLGNGLALLYVLDRGKILYNTQSSKIYCRVICPCIYTITIQHICIPIHVLVYIFYK